MRRKTYCIQVFRLGRTSICQGVVANYAEQGTSICQGVVANYAEQGGLSQRSCKLRRTRPIVNRKSTIVNWLIPLGHEKIYYLSTCDTCSKIIKRLGGLVEFEKQDIKTESITAAQLKEMKEMAGSYEALFSRRAIKYKEMGLKDKVLGENDYKKFILQEYTFLKRPVIINGSRIFIGNEKKTVEEAENAIVKK